MKLRPILVAAVVAALLTGNAVARPDIIRVGFISTLSGPAGADGIETLNGYKLALEHTGGKLGGIPAQLFTGDDQARPQIAIQLARQMIDRDEIHFMSGLVFSHVGEAVSSVVLPTDRLVVAILGGSSTLAGAGCQDDYFITSWNTDTMFEAIGAYLARKGIKRVAAVAANYQAGWDAVAGLKLGYKGDLVAEVLVQLTQSDFGSELSQLRAAGPEALVMFLPGGAGIAFQRQFHQSGLQNTVEPYVATFQADETTFNALGESAVGLINAGPWNPNLDNPSNRRFVTAFRERYGRNPSILAAMAYDTVLALDAAVTAIGGNVEDTAAFREAMRTVKFDSVRGSFSFNNNHFPVQDYYLSRIARNSSGALHNELVERVFEAKADSHHDDCPKK